MTVGLSTYKDLLVDLMVLLYLTGEGDELSKLVQMARTVAAAKQPGIFDETSTR